MRRLLLIPAVLAATLVASATALAGGWATAGVSSTPSDREWDTQITLMQHGRTPLDGVTPAIVVTDASGRATRFDAKPSGKPGVYDVHVVFPAPGRYTYTVDDGFGNAFPHEFPPVTIGGEAASSPAPASDEDGIPALPFLLAAAAVALASGGVFALRRLRGGAQPA